jgi:drug/metabolite transporter (DMT)-like permease
VPLLALALALGSAVLHAVWNLLLGRARDIQAATAATFLLSVAIALPFAVAFWHADSSVWPWALASTALETVYVVTLAASYRLADVSVAYPLSRGLAPVIVLAVSVIALSHHATATELVGVLLVGIGATLVRSSSLDVQGRALILAVTLASTIAAYTLVDRVGIHRAGALAYFVLTLAGPCLVYPPLVGFRAIRGAVDRAVGVAAVANLGSFVLGLLALRHAGAAAVLAVRSSSIVIATVLARRVLAEHVSRTRLAGAVLVFGGIALLAA